MTTGPSQIQPDTQREGPAEHRLDQKAPGLTEGRAEQGGNEARRERAMPKQLRKATSTFETYLGRRPGRRP